MSLAERDNSFIVGNHFRRGEKFRPIPLGDPSQEASLRKRERKLIIIFISVLKSPKKNSVVKNFSQLISIICAVETARDTELFPQESKLSTKNFLN